MFYLLLAQIVSLLLDLCAVIRRSERHTNLQIRSRNSPPRANRAAIGTRRFPKPGKKALDPPIDGAAINTEPAFSEPLDDVGVAQAIVHRVAHGEGDDGVGKRVV